MSNTIRSRLWLWGHHPGSHDHYNLPQKSRMTAAEGAFYLSIPNLIMVKYGPYPKPPYDQLAISFDSLDQVVWSVVGSGGQMDDAEEVLALTKHKNFKGVIFDDFWSSNIKNNGIVLDLDEMNQLHQKIKSKNLDSWAVLYISELHCWEKIKPYLQFFDHFTLWCWDPEEASQNQSYLETLKQRVPDKKIYMGCYLYDYGRKKPMPEGSVEQQCRLGFTNIRSGLIEGLIFIGSPVLDVGLKDVEKLREWIKKV